MTRRQFFFLFCFVLENNYRVEHTDHDKCNTQVGNNRNNCTSQPSFNKVKCKPDEVMNSFVLITQMMDLKKVNEHIPVDTNYSVGWLLYIFGCCIIASVSLIFVSDQKCFHSVVLFDGRVNFFIPIFLVDFAQKNQRKNECTQLYVDDLMNSANHLPLSHGRLR